MTWHKMLECAPQSARQFGEWLADQLNEDVETYEVARTTDSIGLIKMTRNGVDFRVTVEVEGEE